MLFNSVSGFLVEPGNTSDKFLASAASSSASCLSHFCSACKSFIDSTFSSHSLLSKNLGLEEYTLKRLINEYLLIHRTLFCSPSIILCSLVISTVSNSFTPEPRLSSFSFFLNSSSLSFLKK